MIEEGAGLSNVIDIMNSFEWCVSVAAKAWCDYDMSERRRSAVNVESKRTAEI
jgi:hypothetical protein